MPLVNASLLQERIKFIGIAFHNSFEKIFTEKEYKLAKNAVYRFIIKVNVPVKDSGKVLDFEETLILYPPIQGFDEILNELMKESPDEAQKYYYNTFKVYSEFIEKINILDPAINFSR